MAIAADGSQPTATPPIPETTPTDTPPGITQGTLAAKQDPEAPRSLDKMILGPDSYAEKFSDRKIYVMTAGNQEQISEALYQIFLK